MRFGSPHIRYWYNPTPHSVGPDLVSLLQEMDGPTLIHVPGRQRERIRAICTLLHGNEPSGARAIHRWLQEGIEPETDVLCFFGAVHTALTEPVFYYRHLPHQPDLNRCFKPPFDSEQGKLAKAILDILQDTAPEALLDIHNTSGAGPAFAVSRKEDEAHLALCSLFTRRVLMTQLRLGALFEYSERNVPTVTIECGGSQDSEADAIAYRGLIRFLTQEQVLSLPEDAPAMEILREPVRLELDHNTTLSIASRANPLTDMTLPRDVENLNFGHVLPDTRLGWVHPDSWDKLRIHTAQGKDVKDRILRLKGNELYPAQALKLFMITTNPTIAKTDCVFYAVTDDGSHLD